MESQECQKKKKSVKEKTKEEIQRGIYKIINKKRWTYKEK